MTASDRHSKEGVAAWLRSNIRGGRRHAVYTITTPAGSEASSEGADFEVSVVKVANGRYRVRYTDEVDRTGLTPAACAALVAEIARRVRDTGRKIVHFDDLNAGPA